MKHLLTAILVAGLVLIGNGRAEAQDSGRPLITPKNVSQLTALRRLGPGSFEYVDWSPDGKTLAVAGSMGLWLYDARNLTDEPRLFEAFGAKQGLTFSPDGTQVALSMYSRGDNVVRLWNPTSGQPGPIIKGGNALFSPNSRLLASRTGNDILLWDVATGTKLHTLQGHTAYSNGLAFSPDSRLLVSSSWDGSARLWDVSTGRMLFKWDNHAANNSVVAPAVTFTPDNTQVVSAGKDSAIRWWNVSTGQRQRIVEGPLAPDGLRFSPDGSLLGVSSGSGLWLLDGANGKLLRVLKNHHNRSVLFSPDSTMVVSTVVLWDVATGKSLRMLEGGGHGSTWSFYYGPAISPDGTRVAEIGMDGAVWVWDVYTGKRLDRVQGIYSQITRGAFSPNSRHLISSGLGNVWLWDVVTGANVRVFRGSEDLSRSINAFSATFNPDGSLIAVGDVGYVVRVLDANTGQEICKMQGKGTGDKNQSGIVSSLVYSPDGKLLASGGYSGATKVWDVAACQEHCLLGDMVDPVSDLAFSPDGKLLARASGFDSIKTMLWDITTGKEVCTLEDLAGRVVFSPDGSMLVTADTDKVLRLWDVKTCQQVRMLKGHTDMVSGLAFNPDGRLLASGSGDNTLRLWDITTGNLLHKVDPVDPEAKNSAAVSYLTFSPDGTLLAVEHSGGDIWLFGIPKT